MKKRLDAETLQEAFNDTNSASENGCALAAGAREPTQYYWNILAALSNAFQRPKGSEGRPAPKESPPRR
jgi:hypothetical protein